MAFFIIFRDAWIVKHSKYVSKNSLFSYSLKRRSNATLWSFDLEYLEGFCNNKFCINLIEIKEMLFNRKPWIHSINNHSIIHSIVLMVFVDIVLAVCDDIYFIVSGAVVSLSFLINSILGLLLSDGFFSLHSVLCRFSPVSVLYALFQYWCFKCSFDRNLN